MSNEERTIEEVLREMLWDARDAARLRRVVPLSLFGDLAPVVAVIAHHDTTHPTAPREGADRVASIVAHAVTLADDVTTNRARYTDPAAGLQACATGGVDPLLLSRVHTVLRELPSILTGPDQPLQAPRTR